MESLLYTINEYPVVLTMAIMGGCVATMAVPKQPVMFHLVANMTCGVFFSMVCFFYLLDANIGVSKNKLRSIIGIASLIGTPAARLVLELAHDKTNWLAIWNKFKGKKS